MDYYELLNQIRFVGLHVPPNIRYGRVHLTYEFDSEEFGFDPFLHIDRDDPTENPFGHPWEAFSGP